MPYYEPAQFRRFRGGGSIGGFNPVRLTQHILDVTLSDASFIAGGGSANSVIGAIGVLVSPMTPSFNGTLDITGPDASLFDISSSTLPSNLIVGPVDVSPGTYNINIVATTTGGEMFTLAITVTPSGKLCLSG